MNDNHPEFLRLRVNFLLFRGKGFRENLCCKAESGKERMALFDAVALIEKFFGFLEQFLLGIGQSIVKLIVERAEFLIHITDFLTADSGQAGIV